MKLLIATLGFLLFSPTVFGQVHKCQLPDGRIEYRSIPCGAAKALPADEANAPVQRGTAPQAEDQALRRECQQRQMRMHFRDMSTRVTFQTVADFAGHKLVLDPAVGGKAAYHYDCVDWETVLQDLAKRHHLVATVDNGVIRVAPPVRQTADRR